MTLSVGLSFGPGLYGHDIVSWTCIFIFALADAEDTSGWIRRQASSESGIARALVPEREIFL